MFLCLTAAICKVLVLKYPTHSFVRMFSYHEATALSTKWIVRSEYANLNILFNLRWVSCAIRPERNRDLCLDVYNVDLYIKYTIMEWIEWFPGPPPFSNTNPPHDVSVSGKISFTHNVSVKLSTGTIPLYYGICLCSAIATWNKRRHRTRI